MFQIPQPAVDEFCRAAGRAGGEIALFDQRDAQAAQRRQAPGLRRLSPADDQDVENLFGESRKRFAPRAPENSVVSIALRFFALWRILYLSPALSL